MADEANKLATAIFAIYSFGNVVRYEPSLSFDIRSGFSHRTTLSFINPVSSAETYTWVGISSFFKELVKGNAIMFGLNSFPRLFWKTTPGLHPLCSFP